MLVPLPGNISVAPQEGWWSSWEGVKSASEWYFSLRPTEARILETYDNKYHIVEKFDPNRKQDGEWIIIALKIVSYATVIIPMVVVVLRLFIELFLNDDLEKPLFYYRDPDLQDSAAFFKSKGVAEGWTNCRPLLALYPHLPPCPDKLNRLAAFVFMHAIRVVLPTELVATSFLSEWKEEFFIEELCALDPLVILEVPKDSCCSVLSQICSYGHIETVKRLTENWDFSIFERRFAWDEAFGFACLGGYLDVVRYMYKKHPVKLNPSLHRTEISLMIYQYKTTKDAAEKKRFEELFTYFCETEPLKTELCKFLVDEIPWELNGAFGAFMRSKGMSFNLLGAASGPSRSRENLSSEELSNLYNIIFGPNSPPPKTKLQCKRAFRAKALELHPDKHGGSDALFKELSFAWTRLQETSEYEGLPKD